jgi:hypothetical protein
MENDDDVIEMIQRHVEWNTIFICVPIKSYSSNVIDYLSNNTNYDLFRSDSVYLYFRNGNERLQG